MADRSVITGRVVDVATGAGIAGLRVEGLDTAGLFRDLLGYARTDGDGGFRMEVLHTDLVALVGKRAVVAYLRVLDTASGAHVLVDTRSSGPKWPLDGRASTVVLRASPSRVLARLPDVLPFVVSGTLHDEDGPVGSTAVQLFDRNPGSGALTEITFTEETWTTDARGHFRITYNYSGPSGKVLPDLIVRALTSPTTDTETRCHAPPSLAVAMVKTGHKWRGASTYTRINSRLQSTASALEIPVRNLTTEQRDRLACSHRMPLAEVTAVTTAHAIVHDSSPLQADVVFAAVARGMGTDRDSFFQHPKSAIKEALTAAVAANLVPQRFARETERDAALEDWVTAAAAWSLESRSDSEPCGLGELLAVAGISDEGERTSFAQQLCRNEAAMPDFWTSLEGFDKPRLQLTFQWWSLARGHLPLIEHLEAKRVAETDETLLDLAQYSEADWLGILNTITPDEAGAPLDIPGDNPEERKGNYARVLYATMANAFPTKVFGQRVLSVDSGVEDDVQPFFTAHPEFEFGKNRLSHGAFADTVALMTSDGQRRIKAMERLFRLAPRYEHVTALLAKGYDSAHRAHAAGKNKFVQDLQEEEVSVSVALELYQKACWQVGAASLVSGQLGVANHRLQARPFANFTRLSLLTSPEHGNAIPDYQTLFGNAGGCSCTHCAGVLGPAAYLTDSLMWLDRFDSEVPRSGSTKWTALDVLVGAKSTALGTYKPPGRRPDLKLLELTCKSAHTPLPYIDIVNEILEVAVANDARDSDPALSSPIKSSFEPEELAAGPEIIHEVAHIEAWRVLMERRHPFTLPVCLFDRESEAYLRYLGVTRADLVETLGGSATDTQRNELAKARLGVRDDAHASPDALLLSGWKMLIGADSGTALEHWGGQSATSLEAVPTFLKYAGLTFAELEELLATRYVNGDDGEGALGLAAVVLDPEDGCDTSEMKLHLDLEDDPPLTAAHLLRLHRFLRLRLMTGLSSTDLDRLLVTFWIEPDPPTPITIDAAMLRKVTEAQALAKDLKLTVREVAGLFADLDIHERWEKKSPYRQYFLNRLVDSPESTVFSDVLDTPESTAKLRLHKTALQRALGITEKELLLLVDEKALAADLLLPPEELVVADFLPEEEEEGEEAELAILPRVSALWRTVRFARALGLSVADYLVLRAHDTAAAPIGPGAEPVNARAFVELVRDWKTQKLTVPELQWVLRAFAPPGAGLGFQDAAVEALRSEITSAVAVIKSETETTEDPADPEAEDEDRGGRAFSLLDQLLGDAERDAVYEVLQGSNARPDGGAWRDRIEHIKRYLPRDLLDGEEGEVEEPDDWAGAKDLLAGPPTATPSTPSPPPYLKSPAERFAYVAKWLDRYVRASRIVAEMIATATKLPVSTITHLVTTVLASQGSLGAEYNLLDDFLPANKPGANAADQARGLEIVLRHARMIAALRVGEPIPPGPEAAPGTSDDPGELTWLYPTSPGSTDLHLLPATQPVDGAISSDDRGRFVKLVRLARRIGLRDRMTGGPNALRELFEELPGIVETSLSELEQAQMLVAEKSGWNLPTIKLLCDHLSIGEVADFLDEKNLLELEMGVALVRRLGIDPADVFTFLNLESLPPAAVPSGLQPTTVGPKNARDLVLFARRAAGAKLSADEWQKVAKKVRDPFREMVRDRLVDALVPHLHASRSDLYGFHLIDVDMGACMMTSRIVQATNAVQVFVQRSFLRLDAEVHLPEEATAQWEWRKAYRVWEANRKVFLWPENWLEPELREDMTPLFRDFQTQLASGELTDASAERALEKYLTGLHEIARLEPMALWYDEENETDHVLARTRNHPYKWFYRRREANLYWTAWVKTELDIDAESVVLMGANRRLYVFWPQLVLKNDAPSPAEVQANKAPLTPPGPAPTWDMKESGASYASRYQAWEDDVTEWNKDLPDPDAPEPDPVQRQHYEVRVAWSSYVEGAWTPKRLSDCTPIYVFEAKGEGPVGYEPRHVVLVLEPQSAELPEGMVRLQCIATPWFPFRANFAAGRFRFDACGGGRWTSVQLTQDPYVAGAPPFTPYQPMAPENGRLSRMGFEQIGTAGPVSIHHVPYGQTASKKLALLGDHDRRFAMVSPSSYNEKPTHAFDRFFFADGTFVFHARYRRPKAKWNLSGLSMLGEVAGMQPADDRLANVDPVISWSQSQMIKAPLEGEGKYVFELFEHPYVCDFANRLAAKGVSGLLGWRGDPELSAQFQHEEIAGLYLPTANVESFPRQEVSFALGSTYGIYNWELFFHVPFTIAQKLSQEGRYAEAQKWFHTIFNPMSGLGVSGPKRFWCVKPFYEIDDIDTIQEDLTNLAAESSFAASLQALVAEEEAPQKAADEMKAQIAAMSKQPFAPHVLARMRPLAYMKNVVMRYLQNLLDWGDSLFRRDTMESLHEALTLYLLAAELLGPKPDLLEHKADPPGMTFEQLLDSGLDTFGNAAVEVETIVPRHPPIGFKCTDDGPPMPDFRLYFCIPPNDQLSGYWDLIADRLFKIRNCMNIDGVVRTLALFAPPIDPAILVRAAAAGVRLDQVLDALAAPSPLYRFVRLQAKAVEFAGAVQALGQGLLSALEKKDGEELALVRQRHEIAVLDADREVRKLAIQEAKQTLEGLRRSRQIAETRLQHYVGLLDRGLLSQEKEADAKTREARLFRQLASAVNELDTFLAAIPDIATGMMPAATIGGRALQQATGAVSRKLSSEADSKNTDASLAQTAASYARRAQEWKLQKSVGEKELGQLDRQIAAQEIRVAIAEREMENLDLRREHTREVDAFFRTKFTNQDLYSWMAAQVAAEHYRAYQTAYDMAKKAERAYQLERGDESTSFIRFGAWDSLKKGLLSGERLLQDLRALDAAYLSRSDREREITKHVSLSEIAGEQLTLLRDTGEAQLDLHTYHFDADYPGHYFRRLKTVAISVATVRPAADGVQCELTLLQSSYRKTSQIGSVAYPGNPYADSLHRYSTAATKALVTSTADNDPGLFEVSLKDEMLLPFEGSGAVSQWRVEIDPKTNRFPMHRISDVVLHLRYTAKDGGAGLREAALAYAEGTATGTPPLPVGLTQRTRVFSARRDFDVAWAVFTAGTLLETPADTWVNRLELPFAQGHFRSFFGDPKVKIVRIQVSATFNEKHLPAMLPGSVAYELARPVGSGAAWFEGSLEFRAGEPSAASYTDASVYQPPELPPAPRPPSPLPVNVKREDDESFEPWIFDVPASEGTPEAIRSEADGHFLLKPDAFEDIWFVVTYEVQP